MPHQVDRATSTDGFDRMNIYTSKFVARCPENGDAIDYSMTIATQSIVMVEKIELAINELTAQPAHHEFLADRFWRLFGGRQVMVATHGRVSIQTIRG